jgi:hypothetical protein
MLGLATVFAVAAGCNLEGGLGGGDGHGLPEPVLLRTASERTGVAAGGKILFATWDSWSTPRRAKSDFLSVQKRFHQSVYQWIKAPRPRLLRGR